MRPFMMYFRTLFVGILCWLTVGLAAMAQQAPEFRALWADTFHAGMRNSNEVNALVNTARAGNFNAIIVEVRKRCDAYYNSSLEPKASDVSPQSYDPLADLLNKAHNGGRRIEVHAWITTYLVWNAGVSLPPQANHPYYTHPDWFTRDITGAASDGSNYQFDQSLPEVQRYTYNVAMDIISRYDVDGFHFDYVRFSGRNWGYHSNALDRFRRRFNTTGIPAATEPNWLQFRRDQVSGLVRKVYLNALAVKPQVKISAATICFAPGIVNDSQWFSSASAWNNVLQDWRGWMQEGILDLNIPMMYFDHRRYANEWNGWSIFAKEHTYGRHVALGQGSYLNILSNVIHQLRTTRLPTTSSNAVAQGMAMYSYAVPVTNDTSAATAFNALVRPTAFDPNPAPLFAEPVPVPVMPWKVAPTLGHVKGTIRGAATSNEIDGAVVFLAGPQNRVQTNDGTGFYGFAHLPPGSYTLTATYSNLAGQSAVVLVTTGVVSTIDFFLSTSNSPVLNLRAFPGSKEAIVAWTTPAMGDSQVEFGLTASLGNLSVRDPNAVSNHAVLITGLMPNTNYFYRVSSRVGFTTNISAINSFTTAGEIIIDNRSATLTGGWTPGTSSTDKFGSDYVFASTTAASTATYTPFISTPGRYDVQVWYPQGQNRSTNAPFLLIFDGGSLDGGVNQTANGGTWRTVATNLPFARGTGGYFQWHSDTAETGKVIMADAVRFIYAANQEPPGPGSVPQWWRDFYFGGTVNVALDPDSDGIRTVDEYVTGTDPLRGSSKLSSRLEGSSNDLLGISFSPFHSGRVYQLEAASLLATNGWAVQGLSPQIMPNGNGLFPVTDVADAQKFYRLRVHLSP